MKNEKILNLFSKHSFFYKVALKKIIKSEGGEKESQTLRKIVRDERRVNIGLYSYGACFNDNFSSGGNVTIGKYCSFGENVRFFGANHPMEHLSMSPYFYNKTFSGYEVKDIKRTDLEIGNDVWVGYGVVITSSCKRIGNGAVIGAATVVTKDVPPYSVVAGNPGKVLRYRFGEETIRKIEESKWWEKEPQEIMKVYGIFENPTAAVEFLSDINKGENNES